MTTKGVPYNWEISQPDGNDEGTDISRYSSLGAPELMHCDTLKQDNDSTVRGDGGSRVGEVRAGTTSPMPEHKGFKLQ